ncbi:MAG TPA: hypothetical protein VF108_00945 [Actinomycetota bacterium]
MRGADGNPHQVRLEDARVIELGGRSTTPMGVEPATLDVAPNRDLFVPFEYPVVDLDPGWYAIECSVVIDGSPATVRPGSRFSVPWPRGSTRRDQLDVGASAQASGGKVRVDRVECSSDSVRLAYEGVETPVSLAADGEKVPVLEATFDAETGTGTVVAYPVLKTQHRLEVSFRGADAPIEIALP